MPSIKDESTVEKIASVFCGEGKRNKTETLRIVGYSEGYADNGTSSAVVFGNVRVKAAIARIDTKTAEKMDYSIQTYRQELDEAREHAQALRQPSAEVSAIVAKGRSCGYDKDNDMGNKDKPLDVTPEQVERWSRMAAAANRDRIKLGKDTA